MCAVVKGNAFGHGLVSAAHALEVSILILFLLNALGGCGVAVSSACLAVVLMHRQHMYTHSKAVPTG
jgi:alanine racemase